MGNGIAQVAARAGYSVVMRDLKDEFLQRALKSIDKSLQRDVDKERLSAEEKQSIVERITTTTEIETLKEAAFVIEAVSENLEIKTNSFKRSIESRHRKQSSLRTLHRFRSLALAPQQNGRTK